jgi:type II secretory pathway component PulK
MKLGFPKRLAESGLALITALVVIFVVAATALVVSARQHAEMSRIAGLFGMDDAHLLLREIESESLLRLRQDSALGNVDSLSEPWATEVLTLEAGPRQGKATLADLQGRFNINNLVANPAFQRNALSIMGGAAAAAMVVEPEGNAIPSAADRADSRGFGAASPGAAGMTSTGSAPAWADNPELTVDEMNRGNSTAVLQRTSASAAAAAAQEVPGMPGAPTAGAAATSQAFDPARQGIAGRMAARASRLQRRLVNTSPGASGATVAQPGRGASPPWQLAEAQFRLLLEQLDIDPEITQAILDWLDPDSETRYPNGAEDDYYIELDEPYRAANGPIVDLSELKLIRGVTDEIVAKLEPFLVALPAFTLVNVNTAPKEILRSLSPAIDEATANTLINRRDVQPFMSSAEFFNHPSLLGRPMIWNSVMVSTQYFGLKSEVSSGGSTVYTESVIMRSGAGLGSVIRRERGIAPILQPPSAGADSG